MLMKLDQFILDITDTPASDRLWAYLLTVVPAMYGIVGIATLLF